MFLSVSHFLRFKFEKLICKYASMLLCVLKLSCYNFVFQNSNFDDFLPFKYWGVAYLQAEMTCKIEGNGWRMSRGSILAGMEIYVLLGTALFSLQNLRCFVSIRFSVKNTRFWFKFTWKNLFLFKILHPNQLVGH